MDNSRFSHHTEFAWEIAPHGAMRVPAIIYADEKLIHAMDDKVFEQICNVATLPGIVKAAYAMPDAHWGYGFPIGGVAAFDPEEGGIVSAGGVGFDISCGVRCLHTGLKTEDITAVQKSLADSMFIEIPAGLGSTSSIRLNPTEMDTMLQEGAAWAVKQGYGNISDLERIEEQGQIQDARPDCVSAHAKQRQHNEMGTLGSGNHYLEVQKVAQIFDTQAANVFGVHENDVLISIHSGSRGLGHQIGTEFLREMVTAAPLHGISLPDRELACAPINSLLGQNYLGAMRAAINCALANRQILTHLTRQVFFHFFPNAHLQILYDVSHNTCKVETHIVDDKLRKLYVHRKGATRAFGPGHPDVPATLSSAGQPVLIGGSMGTSSYILSGTKKSEALAFSSACHGAGRAMSRHQANKTWKGRQVLEELATREILVRSPSLRGVAEEAPDAYKDVSIVVNAADKAGLARKVARLEPLICIKG